MIRSALKWMLHGALENGWIYAARVFLICLLMAAPLAFGSVEPWAWAGMVIFIVLIALVWVGSSVKAGQLNLSWTPLYLPILLLLLLVIVQGSLNATFDSLSAGESVVKLAAYTVTFVLAREVFRGAPEKVWSRFGLAVTAYIFALALFATIQFNSSPGLLYWTRRPRWGGIVFGPYVNHNHYAGLMEILLPMAIGYVISLRRSGAQPGLVFAVMVAIASVLLSGSRGGMISLFGEFIVFGAILLRRNRQSSLGKTAIIASLSFGAVILLLFVWLDPGDVTKRLEQTATSPEMSISDRKQYARDSIRMFRDYPWTGVGVGSFEAAYPRYQSFSSDLVVNHAHNDYLEALAESGVIGSVLILSALVLFLRLLFLEVQGSQDSSDWIRVGAVVGCCGLLIHSFSDFNLHIPANAAWFAFTAGLATLSTEAVRTHSGMTIPE